ncbi:hypothetical protein V6Z12_D07G164600 [Gossypium hirsutum]
MGTNAIEAGETPFDFYPSSFEFIWPDDDKPCLDDPELVIQAIDLGAFLLGDSLAVSKVAEAVNEACKKHGFFLVVSSSVHGPLLQPATL